MTCEASIVKYNSLFKIILAILFITSSLLIICPESAYSAPEPTTSNAFAASNAFMGVGSCSSSNCHGSVSPRNATNVLQNEYVTWEKHDPHSKAWINLTNEDSKRIAYNLGIENPEKEPWCLRCHATYLEDDARKGANFHIEDGVGCESCHGAAEKYLGPHTANDATRESNLANGMLDVVSPSKRVKLCASCHFGDESQYVNHRLIGAGHPRLTFKFDTFSMIKPKMGVVDEDFIKKKADYTPANAWLLGQIELALLSIERLNSDKLSKDGIYPELTIFYCYACHHSLSEEQWKKREYSGRPGELQLNIASVVIVKEALGSLDKNLSNLLELSLQSLHENYKQGKKTDLKSLETALLNARKLIEKSGISVTEAKIIINSLSSYGAKSLNLQYELAEQIAMGISSLLASAYPDDTMHDNEIKRVYAALSDAAQFEPHDFSNALADFKAKFSR